MEFTRIEGANFNPVPQKVPMRYSFSLDQKRILIKHYENGMFGQSLAYQDKIVVCAREAGVDFDIVRNWIGNMRRKRRMESAPVFPMPNTPLQHDQSAEKRQCFIMGSSGHFHGPQYVIRNPPNGLQQIRPANPELRAGGTGLTVPMSTPTILRNSPLAPRDQNITVPTSGGMDFGHPSTAPTTISPAQTKQESESEQKTTCSATPNSASQPNQGTFSIDRFPEETAPMMRGQGSGSGSGQDVDEFEWRQQQIQRIMQQVQQSVHQLENLGCECVVATLVPTDGGTYITGTPVAVQYFSEIQKVQPMAEYINPSSPASVTSDDVENDATEETNKPVDSQGNQSGLGTGEKNDLDNRRDVLKETGDDCSRDNEKNVHDLKINDKGVIRSGEEVYIVNKEHYVIGTGTLLPAPHRRIELKNAPH